MNILVTGAAGFIGSHLCEQLLKDKKNKVTAVDGLIHPGGHQRRNLDTLLKSNHPGLRFHAVNLLSTDLAPLLRDVDVVFHLAGMPGVRSSWGDDFYQYALNNILATQKLLEACSRISLKKFIYISTSSVYGEKNGKVSEDAQTQPLSPYGVSKLSAEHLCRVYKINEGVPVVILRYFTVYGPRQRPDMAFHRFIRCMLNDQPISVFGDGLQTRDFTYVEDCVAGTTAVLHADDVVGKTFNIGGTERASVLDVITLIGKLMNKVPKIVFSGPPKGEPRHTHADISAARRWLNYQPAVSLRRGLKAEIEDLKLLYGK